ncbi:deoxynucleoside kinase [Ectothiorhodospiraceae bacterium WFHF3C12]|nr:deoxynucleoside kinase [Ectothiorhodospiraceae bacterium WFHF3C12]
MSEIPGYLVVEGPIGVGKTSLSRRLAESFGAELLLEKAEENPFLERFYRQPRDAAFPAQLYFLLQRAEQLRALRQTDMFRPRLVADFLFDKDRVFAELNLDADEMALYERVYSELALSIPRPDLVVYLQAPVEVLQARISKRGIGYEQGMDPGYLERLSEAYIRFFYHYDGAPLLIVNTSEINPVENDPEYELLLDRIQEIRSGRHYFNPSPFAL